MYPRTEYEMTEADLKTLLDACKSVVMIAPFGIPPRSTQENANAAWAELGRRMGFDGQTVRPIAGNGQRFFSAIPSETSEQKTERLQVEALEKKAENIKRLKGEIADRQAELNRLL